MPLPEDQTLSSSAPIASGSGSGSNSSGNALPPARDLSGIMDKFRQLGEEAEGDGEGEGEGDEDGEASEGDEAIGVDNEGATEGQGGEGGKKKKKKKKKSKAGKAVDKLKTIAGGQAPQELIDTVRAEMDPSEQNASDDQIRQALKAVNLMKMLDGQQALGNKSNTKTIGEHKFWKTQPVPQTLPSTQPGSSQPVTAVVRQDPSSSSAGPSSSTSNTVAGNGVQVHQEGPIDPPKTPANVKQEPGALPAGFVWSLIDVKDDVQCAEVYTLLSENYVEDDDAMFRFRYSKEFLLWALTAPGYFPDWHIGVRAQKSGKLVAFISGIKVDIRVRENSFPSAEINFLCVHKKLRSKRLTPVLIKEVTRRVNLQNIWQAIYTAGIVIPTPFSTCRYYHRNLNPVKLVDIGFSPLARGQTIARMARQLAVPTTTQLEGFREMQREDVSQVGRLLRRYLKRFDIEQKFEGDGEVEHWFLSGRGKGEGRDGRVVWAYVVEDPSTGRITDLVSFYSLPSSIMKHAKHDVLNAAYMFYYATDSAFDEDDAYFHQGTDGTDNDAGVGSSSGSGSGHIKTNADRAQMTSGRKARLQGRLNGLVGDALVVAKNAGFDVFNALTLMDNNMFLADQKFGAGDGFLNYYLYNWQCAPIDGGTRGGVAQQGSGIGVVML